MIVEDLARKLYDICTKDGRETIVEGIDIVYDVVPVVPGKIDAYSFDILLDGGSRLRVVASELHQ